MKIYPHRMTEFAREMVCTAQHALSPGSVCEYGKSDHRTAQNLDQRTLSGSKGKQGRRLEMLHESVARMLPTVVIKFRLTAM